VRRAKQACFAVAIGVTLLPGIGNAQTFEQSDGSALNVPQSQQELDLPSPSTTARPRPKSRPQRARSENLELSRNLATFLHNHRLPYVDAHVFEDADSSQVVILSGFVATQFGRNDAIDKARQFLGESAPEPTNQIVVDPTVSLRPPAQFVSQGNLGEVLPRTFEGCWLCLPKTSSGMTVGWSCDNEAVDGRVSDPAAACHPIAVHAASAA
jgi:hypothetical protein